MSRLAVLATTPGRPAHARLLLWRAAWLTAAVGVAVLLIAAAPVNVATIRFNWQIRDAAPALPSAIASDALALGVLVARYLAAAAYIAVSIVIARQKWDEWPALLAATTLFLMPAAMNMGGYVDSWSFAGPLEPALSAADQLVRFVTLPLLALWIFLFPDGRWVPPRLRGLFLTLFAANALYWPLAILVLPVLLPPDHWLFDLRWGDGMLLFIATVLIGLAAQVHRYRKVASAEQRQQGKWVLAGLIVTFGWFGLTIVWWALTDESRGSGAALLNLVIGECTQLFLPVSIGFAVLRRRLWDIDPILSRTLVYGALTAFVLVGYGAVVGMTGAIAYAGGDVGLAVLATALIAVLFNPVRQRLQRLVNRALYGQRDEPVTVLSQLGRQLEFASTPDDALQRIADTLRQALRFSRVEIMVGAEVAAGAGEPAAVLATGPVSFELIHQSRHAGTLRVWPRPAEDTLSPKDHRLIEAVAQHAGASAHALGLVRDLQRSRERIVGAREEERRRMRRDLHDGLGPTLAAQTLALDAVLDLLGEDADPAAVARARELVGRVMGQTQVTVADVRRLVYGLRPPALDELGLAGALQEQFGHSLGSPRVSIAVAGLLPPLPAAIEVAAYRIASEAITNAVRHARAATCTVTLAASERSLALQVIDDGRGLPGQSAGGVGLSSMRERAEEVGGTLAITSELGGGTTVVASLPLE